MLDTEDMNTLKAVFDDCEINAYERGYGKETALHFYGVPDELVRWLVSQGLDIDVRDEYGRTPLDRRAQIGRDVSVFLELGADVNSKTNSGETPLHFAAIEHNANTVKQLIDHGANIEAKEAAFGRTPLSTALSTCRNADIANMAIIAETFLNAGAHVDEGMRHNVERIGKDFEFFRESFNKDYLAETEAGLARLYALFGVEPVAERRTYDGVSPIIVIDGPWEKQYSQLWDYLVPGTGPASTVQGEAIRIAGRVSHEILDNGGANWDADFRKMLNALVKFFSMGTPLTQEELELASTLASQIRGDDESSQLARLAVRWVAKNPDPIALETPPYKR